MSSFSTGRNEDRNLIDRCLNQYHKIQRLALLNPENKIITDLTRGQSYRDHHVHLKMNSDYSIKSEIHEALRKTMGVQGHISYMSFDYFGQQPEALAASLI